MILGLGLDLCDTARMERLLEDGRFLKRYFAEEEQAYIEGRGKQAAASLAACFAAKEAFVKALGLGFAGAPPLDIVILHDGHGRPYYDLRGQALTLARQRGVVACHLSLSHEGGTAAAVAVLEGK